MQNFVLQWLSKFLPIPETMMTDVDALTSVEETGNITAASVGLGIVKNFEPGGSGERILDVTGKNFVLGRLKPHTSDESSAFEAEAEAASKRCVVCKSKFKLGR